MTERKPPLTKRAGRVLARAALRVAIARLGLGPIRLPNWDREYRLGGVDVEVGRGLATFRYPKGTWTSPRLSKLSVGITALRASIADSAAARPTDPTLTSAEGSPLVLVRSLVGTPVPKFTIRLQDAKMILRALERNGGS